jgi:hypothetical protein
VAEQEDNTNEQRQPQSKEELLERIQSAWTELEAAIADLPEDAVTTPGPGGWSVKDNLIHVAAWEQFMLSHYLRGLPSHEAMGTNQDTLRGLDETGLNRMIYERNRDRATADVLYEFRRSHQQVVEAIGATPWEKLTAPNPEDQQGRPVLEWVVGNTYDHYDEHRENIVGLQTPFVLGD